MVNLIGWTITIIAGVFIIAIAFWKFYFLRKPKRKIPEKGTVSPASGKVIKIIDYEKENINIKKGLWGKVKLMTKDIAKEGHVIVIMMTPFDVHYQRAPIKGEVEEVNRKKGSLLNAVNGAENLKASFENENNSITIKKGKLKIKVVQVAGYVARRIESYVKNNQKIHKGQILGRINLGSQVLLVLPKMKILVKEGQRVVDGETVIAERIIGQ